MAQLKKDEYLFRSEEFSFRDEELPSNQPIEKTFIIVSPGPFGKIRIEGAIPPRTNVIVAPVPIIKKGSRKTRGHHNVVTRTFKGAPRNGGIRFTLEEGVNRPPRIVVASVDEGEKVFNGSVAFELSDSTTMDEAGSLVDLLNQHVLKAEYTEDCFMTEGTGVAEDPNAEYAFVSGQFIIYKKEDN